MLRAGLEQGGAALCQGDSFTERVRTNPLPAQRALGGDAAQQMESDRD